MVQDYVDAIVDELQGQILVSMATSGILMFLKARDYQGPVVVYCILIATISGFVLWQMRNSEGRANWMGLSNFYTLVPRMMVNILSCLSALGLFTIFLNYLGLKAFSTPAELKALTDGSLMVNFCVSYLSSFVAVAVIRWVGNVLIVLYVVVGIIMFIWGY